MPDSLTPPLGPTQSTHPDTQTRRRSTWMWLLSGVAAALLLLGLGISFTQWLAWEEPHRTPRHAASGRPGLPSEVQEESEARAAPAEPSDPARALQGQNAEKLSDEPKELSEGGTRLTAPERPAKEPAPRSTPSAAPRRVAPRANSKVALPDNPY